MRIEEIIFLLIGIPAGIMIAEYCKDELKQGRKWFQRLAMISMIGIIFGILIDIRYLSLTFGFILIVAMISIIKGNTGFKKAG